MINVCISVLLPVKGRQINGSTVRVEQIRLEMTSSLVTTFQYCLIETSETFNSNKKKTILCKTVIVIWVTLLPILQERNI